ncbi:hypothetical protein BYT27DRAFT_7219796 [Phlegmacium glaucopus]|nr:hypothetical protein BYT27DRAFT_7219796 [Phlegmacium glaucopus]
MFFRNNTQAFMAAKFTEAVDYQHLHKLGREKGDEKQRRKEIVEHRDRRQAEKTARKEKREQKAKETADQIAATGIILDKVKALALKVFENAGAPNLMTAKLPTKVADIWKALSDAIDLYEDGKWLLESDTEEGSDDSEEEDESGWEDDN